MKTFIKGFRALTILVGVAALIVITAVPAFAGNHDNGDCTYT